MKVRADMLAAVELSLFVRDLETAKALGESSRLMAERIRTHDYSREDCWLEMEKQAFKAKEPHCSCGYHAAVNNNWKPTKLT